jgi:hypothetical protein
VAKTKRPSPNTGGHIFIGVGGWTFFPSNHLFQAPRRGHMTTIMLHRYNMMKPSRRAIRENGVFRMPHREGVVD